MIGDYLNGFDVAFGNLETTVSDRGNRVGSIYSFRSDPLVAPALASAGFDVMSVANNHIWDYGRDAFIDTLGYLERSDIKYVGGGHSSDDAHDGAIEYVDDTKIGFLAYTNLLPRSVSATLASPGISYLEIEQVKKDISAMRPHVDVLAVSFHWGEEYKTVHNAQQENIAKEALSAGADLIVGHHPHVRQEIVQYGGKTVAYSLGNFIFDQTFSKETMIGLALEVTLKDKKIIAISSRNINISKEYQAYPVY
jgi:poly-gamma-glutamate synthesis protein (capsule biosynthesis protein)